MWWRAWRPAGVLLGGEHTVRNARSDPTCIHIATSPGSRPCPGTLERPPRCPRDADRPVGGDRRRPARGDDIGHATQRSESRRPQSKLRRVSSPLHPRMLKALAARTDFLWHQRFELAPGIFAPGANDVDWLLHTAGVPADLTGASVLDIGTTNGGAAFMLERRGASQRSSPQTSSTRCTSDSRPSAPPSAPQLSCTLQEQFDYVVFWRSSLYRWFHPRSPDSRAVTAHTAYVETAVCDFEAPAAHGDSDTAGSIAATSWAPMAVRAGSLPLCAHWFELVRVMRVGAHGCQLRPQEGTNWWYGEDLCRPGRSQYQTVSYERPLLCSVSGVGPRADNTSL